MYANDFNVNVCHYCIGNTFIAYDSYFAIKDNYGDN